MVGSHGSAKAPAKHGRGFMEIGARLFRAQRCVSIALVAFTSGASCVSSGAKAGVNADASIAGIRSEIRDLNTALLQVRSDLRAGGDVNQNDKWTLRLLGLGVLVLGLSYPVGKIIWIATTAVARRTGARTPQVSAGPTDEYCAFRQGLAGKADVLVQA